MAVRWEPLRSLKFWFNDRFPYFRRCIKPWCMGGQVYNRLCSKHSRY